MASDARQPEQAARKQVRAGQEGSTPTAAGREPSSGTGKGAMAGGGVLLSVCAALCWAAAFPILVFLELSPCISEQGAYWPLPGSLTPAKACPECLGVHWPPIMLRQRRRQLSTRTRTPAISGGREPFCLGRVMGCALSRSFCTHGAH